LRLNACLSIKQFLKIFENGKLNYRSPGENTGKTKATLIAILVFNHQTMSIQKMKSSKNS
jgi:hypothetical protein